MNADFRLSRRSFAGGLALLAISRQRSLAQGFAGLGIGGEGFTPVVPGKVFTFPADFGAHPNFRIEWWYVTANLRGAEGALYGVQWTLFRQASRPGPQQEGWASQQIWMGHAAVTRADLHRFSETFARGGVEQAGVNAQPFQAWIDAWQMRSSGPAHDQILASLALNASGVDFSYALQLDTDRPLVLQGDRGYSQKSNRGQASYYFSQPYFKVSGSVTLEGRSVEVTGQAWMDREWSSQPLAPDQTGWDWFSLHLNSGEKLMLFRLRQTGGDDYTSGNWIAADGTSAQLLPADIRMVPLASTEVESRSIPTAWRLEIPTRNVKIESTALNPRSWMATRFPYWEGPISFKGSHSGIGYLEMTGY